MINISLTGLQTHQDGISTTLPIKQGSNFQWHRIHCQKVSTKGGWSLTITLELISIIVSFINFFFKLITNYLCNMFSVNNHSLAIRYKIRLCKSRVVPDIRIMLDIWSTRKFVLCKSFDFRVVPDIRSFLLSWTTPKILPIATWTIENVVFHSCFSDEVTFSLIGNNNKNDNCGYPDDAIFRSEAPL